MPIDITTTKTEGLERRLAVSVPADDVKSAEDRAARRYATQVRLPGFRPGKAPAAVVRKKFADAIRQEAIESLVQEAFKTVLERDKLDLATQPHIHDLHFHEGEPLTFEMHLEVRPTIALPRTTGFKVKREEKPVTAELVAEQIETIRDQRAAWTPVEERAKGGDMVTVMLATADDSGEIPEGKEYRIVIGGGQAIAGVESLITETDPGTTKEAPVTWPEDFPDEKQRGKTKMVRVQLMDVKRKELPPLDDSFAKEVGEFESLDALKAAVREDLAKHATRDADAEVRQKLMDDIVSANPFDVPPSWVHDLVKAYGDMYQIPDDEKEKFAGEFRPVAERQVRRDLVIETIAAREKLAATEADIDARVAEVAAKRGAEPGAIYASLQKAGRIKEIERSVTEDKVFAWLLEHNEVERTK
jgi:trigger factor